MTQRYQLIARPAARPEERRWLINAIGLLLVLLLLLTACNADGERTRMEPGTIDSANQSVGDTPLLDAPTIDVKLTENGIDMPTSLVAGPVMFKVTNGGETGHNFEIEGEGIHERLETRLEPGEIRTLTVALKPGTFTAYCPIDDHREKGATQTVTVVEAAR